MSLFNTDLELSTTMVNVYLDGRHVSNGTGFFVLKKTDKNVLLYLVTNSHVLQIEDKNDATKIYDADKIVLNILHKGSIPTKAEIDLKIVGKRTFSDKKLDIAIVLLGTNRLPKHLEGIRAIDIDENAWSSDEYIKNGGGNCSNIVMIGYPISTNLPYIDTPIYRKGTVARISNIDTKRFKNIILDIQNYPGNSGSPIFSLPDIVGKPGTKVIDEGKLIGIVHSYLYYEHNIPGYFSKGKPVTIDENTGLALANPVEFIRGLIEDDLSERGL